MAATNTPATMAGYTKDVYGKVKKETPKQAHFLRYAKFAKRKKLGKNYVEPVFLGFENGFTFAKTAAMQNLNDPVAQGVEDATLQGSEVALRTAIARKSLNTAAEAGKASFGNFMKQTLEMMRDSHGNMLELLSVNGNRNIGVVDTGGFTAGSGTATIQITAGSYIPLAWLGRKGIKIDVYDSTGVTKRNSGDLTVTGVPTSLTAPIIAISGSAGDTDAGSIQNGDLIFYKGAKGECATGITEIAGLASGQSYAGIAVDDYSDLWAGTIKAVGGPLTRSKLEEGFTDASMKAAEGDHVILVSPTKWKAIAAEYDGDSVIDRRYDPKMGKFGTKAFTMYTITGQALLVPSLAVRQSEAVAFPIGKVSRIGSADQQFNNVSRGKTAAWEVLTHGSLNVEFRCYADQAVYTTAVKSHILYTGIS